ncbi:fasciclin domain-containing protein [Nocardioides sp. zg-1308]|uniref:Fasciclin domain-containing protein n=1 Tax=Nocardioides renjunii TaxID=3095075 RepID=A0ABU5KF47_9ACTN|nr:MULTISPECIES: fasciclin domain-containing protein [unclassified Nocardioides]MDZ5663070.1 fasciclin domain-containing protein [Nocardioides sp. S-58]NPD05164.1 fasciclin domain-containing protein [Nocardioides sp. zg-1308]WQQ23053.1 fasciclin domain-containing protein [Nocardioides sp. S-34]
MKRRVPALLAASALALGAVQATAPAASAQAAPGEDSLAALLTSDGNTFDKNKNDFDIVTEAALAIVGAKPDSPVALLADGSQKLTVFAPTDQAFRLLAKDLTGKNIKSEKAIFDALVELAGVDTIETVLLYHVVPGKTLTSGKVLKADGAKLATAQGGKIKVKVTMKPKVSVTLKDLDKDATDPKAVLDALDLNKGNKQVAHGIDRVLRPIDL